jgi:release factor glutamine methyltransferase
MPHTHDYLRSLKLSNEDLTRSDRPKTFTMCGKEWDLLDGVFAPIYRPSTGASSDFLDLRELAECHYRSMLEVGSGTGIISVMAALAGCERVTEQTAAHVR